MSAPHLTGPVVVVGAGLIGTSIGMALSRAGVPVYVHDVDRAAAHIAASRGAGIDAEPPPEVQVVVVATPPERLGEEIARATKEWPEAFVTDTGSVKGPVLADAAAAGADVSRYAGGHPMAGSERSGPLAGDPELFRGRSWAVTPHVESSPAAVHLVEQLAGTCGAVVVRLDIDDHDAAVARTSHLPHVMASLVAGRLPDAPSRHLTLSGQGLRDVTRIAAGQPHLWRQILSANGTRLAQLLREVQAEVGRWAEALESDDATTVEGLLEKGVAGTTVIPGKHGGPPLPLATVPVAIPDRPGALADLFTHASEAAVNIEDLRIDHDPGRAYGLVEIDVEADEADVLAEALRARGWAVHR